MSDIGVASAKLLTARAELGIAQQELVIEKKHLRQQELDMEEERIRADQRRLAELAKTAEADAKKKTGIDATRATITAREQRLAIQTYDVRLLELDDEREQVSEDIAASEQHIAMLRAEVSQQTTRLNAQEASRG